MNRQWNWLRGALAVPIIALAGLTIWKSSIRHLGQELTLPIRGYDPRDLLSGHYLIFTVDYGVQNLCAEVRDPAQPQESWVCLGGEKKWSSREPERCRPRIRGRCDGGRFEAGIERFYVPQEKARSLEKLVQKGSASIVLAISELGRAQIKDLLIDGVSWTKLEVEEQHQAQ